MSMLKEQPNGQTSGHQIMLSVGRGHRNNYELF